jgi:UPF0042 nucleotide-binding protein
LIVVTGLSGAGKSHAIRAIEDLGYYCVDNLPIALMQTFVDLMRTDGEGQGRQAAVVIDIRDGQELHRFPAIYRRLARRGAGGVRLVFLEASDAVLQRRFSETRRPHPLALDRPVADGIEEERRRLAPVRRLADEVIDTSALTVHDLRRRIVESTAEQGAAAPLAVTMLSFAFRSGVPPEADLVFDVRFLPNPHFVATLRPRTGRHPSVAAYILRRREATRFLKLTTELLRFLLPRYVAEGKAYLTIAVGCTGGRHRSVAIAEALAKRLQDVKDIQMRVRHRDAAER